MLSVDLSTQAKTAMILPDFKSVSLILIGQPCDNNCDVLLNEERLIAVKNNKVILQGIGNPNDLL